MPLRSFEPLPLNPAASASTGLLDPTPLRGAPQERQAVRVPKEFTHLLNDEAKLVTGWHRLTESSFSVTVEWPEAARCLYSASMLVPQTVRQCGLVVAHAELGAPLTHQTLLQNLTYTAAPGFSDLQNKPIGLNVTIACSPPGRRGGVRNGGHMDFVIRHEGIVVARADADFSWISPAAYRRLRAGHLEGVWGAWSVPDPLAPRLVGRTAPSEVVLAPTGRSDRWQLRNDPDNRALFDHPVDHVPGLVLLEAACQAANALVHPDTLEPAALSSALHSYVELDTPCWIEAAALPAPAPGRLAVEVTGSQQDRTAFRIVLSGPVS